MENDIILPTKEIQSNTISKKDHGNCVLGPQTSASCRLPWPWWYCNCWVLLWHPWDIAGF